MGCVIVGGNRPKLITPERKEQVRAHLGEIAAYLADLPIDDCPVPQENWALIISDMPSRVFQRVFDSVDITLAAAYRARRRAWRERMVKDVLGASSYEARIAVAARYSITVERVCDICARAGKRTRKKIVNWPELVGVLVDHVRAQPGVTRAELARRNGLTRSAFIQPKARAVLSKHFKVVNVLVKERKQACYYLKDSNHA